MRWFRTNAKFGGRLALFALALQFVLSFGHIHAEDIYGPNGAPPRASAAAPGVVTAGLRLEKPLPANPSSKHHDDFCDICATIALLNNSFTAAPPQLPLPLFSHVVEHVDSVAAVFIAPRRTPFQSRAPPAA